MYQPHQIETYPDTLNKELVDKTGKYSLRRADDKVYFRSMAFHLSTNIYFGGGAMVFASGMLYFSENQGHVMLSMVLMLAGLFWVIYALTVNKKNKIFKLDRMAGTITYPDHYFRRPLQGKFKKLKAIISVSGDIDGYVDREYLKFVNTFKPRKLDVVYTLYGDPKKEWSFYVWYMDKNRPLPPGTAFDAYRDQDFKRRKKQGFPKPLYYSRIETPEATPAQQAERKRIGKW